MSVWFKFYPRDLTGHKFQYCQKKQPTVVGIYLWCLCCCAEEGSDTFSWMNSAVEHDGLASTLHISYEQAQSGIGLLLDAKIISMTSVGIKVIGWAEHQSDYMSRKAYYKRRYKDYTVKHSVSPLRGEEKRVQESRLEDPEDHHPVRLPPGYGNARLPRTPKRTTGDKEDA